jgi:hypothetical protein
MKFNLLGWIEFFEDVIIFIKQSIWIFNLDSDCIFDWSYKFLKDCKTFL